MLLHPTSLPGPHGCGDLGEGAAQFVRWLARAGQRWWQTLPVGPAGYGDSPYSAFSAFAGNPLLVDLRALAYEGLLSQADVEATLPEGAVDYAATTAFREARLRIAFDAFRRGRGEGWRRFEEYRRSQGPWLDGYTTYRALKRLHGESAWTAWDPPLRRRDPRALAKRQDELAPEKAYRAFEQFLFARQWEGLRAQCASRGVKLLGDLPIFVAHDSADVWEHPDLFRLDESGHPTVVAGVPPDYFSATGQRWGNPLYRWARHRADGFQWWRGRMAMALGRFDAVRLDHFIGFQRSWEIPASEPTAERGRWRKGPRLPFFRAMQEAFGEDLPLVAEDLGAVTPAVRRLRQSLRLPGIRIVQFAFGTDPQAPRFLPHNHVRNAVVYTGTHDNDTSQGWFHEHGGAGSTRTPAQTEKERHAVLAYTGARDGRRIHWELLRLAMASVANIAIAPMQDVLGLGTSARMNLPGTAAGNWTWRAPWDALTGGAADDLADELRQLSVTYGRSTPTPADLSEASRS